ncbi:hypothetical protein [Leifsonia xyli]|uniref:hypothetical protein n=1 Tax=Leifsonia xyli TaxID=1575 RepID=UPI003D66F08B
MDSATRIEAALNDGLAAVAAGASTSVMVRAALRVAVLRQDAPAELWLRLDLEGISKRTSANPRMTSAMSRMAAVMGTDAAEKARIEVLEAVMARRTFDREGKEVVMAHGIAELEAQTEAMRAIYDAPVTPGMTPLDTGMAALQRDKAQATLAPALLQQRTVLERLKDAAYAYLLDVEAELLAGQALPDVLAEGRAFVEAQLAIRAPAALEALSAAQDRLALGDAEAMSHAATSCRRAIKSLADALYPPGPPVTDDNGVARVMDDEHYRNRLTEYVRQNRGRSTHADLLASNLVTLGSRFKSLDDLASKGVHSDLSMAEADSCVTWTYMLAADLLRIGEESPPER